MKQQMDELLEKLMREDIISQLTSAMGKLKTREQETVKMHEQYYRLKRIEAAAQEDVRVACEFCESGDVASNCDVPICSVRDLWQALEGGQG
jgi:hypothetical protein